MILKTSDFCCPICGNRMFDTNNSLRCMLGHSFDIAKEGYVNLLIKNASGKRYGDDKLMVAARRAFLDKGYYAVLRETIAEVLGENLTILDSGCGEGYYTARFAENNKVLGIDISKSALKYAAKRCKNAVFAVASISQIPLPDACCDAIVNIFAPDSPKEFARVLKNDGRLIVVQPLENHLFELKEAVYEKPYKNPALEPEKEGFRLKSQKEVRYKIMLENNEDIINLFKMTPYYYKTSETDQQKLEYLNALTTSLEFVISEYVKG